MDIFLTIINVRISKYKKKFIDKIKQKKRENSIGIGRNKINFIL